MEEAKSSFITSYMDGRCNFWWAAIHMLCMPNFFSLPQTLGTKSTSRSPIYRCSVCGVAAHFNCFQFAAKDCKCVAQAGYSKVQHHWSERWINLDDNPKYKHIARSSKILILIPFQQTKHT